MRKHGELLLLLVSKIHYLSFPLYFTKLNDMDCCDVEMMGLGTWLQKHSELLTLLVPLICFLYFPPHFTNLNNMDFCDAEIGLRNN